MTITLFLAQSFFSAAMIASFTLLPILAADLSGRDGAVGLPSTVNLLGRALAGYPIGWLMDRVGRRHGLSLGIALGAAGMALAAWAILFHSFLWFLIGVGFFGMGRAASELSRYVAAELQPPDRRAKAIGWIVSAGTVGAVSGPLLVEPSGILVESAGLPSQTGPFLLGLVLLSVALLLVWTLLRPDPKTLAVTEETEAGAASVSGPPLLQLFANAPVLMSLSAMTIGQLVMTFVMVITPLHMDHLHHTTRDISLVIMAHTLGMFGLSWLTGGLIDRYGRVTMIFSGGALLVTAALLAPISSGVLSLAIALFLLGLGWNFCFVAGSSLLATSVAAHEKGRVQGASDVVVALSSGLGSLSSGLVFAAGGIVSVSGLALALVLALLLGTSWFSWSRRGASAEPV